MKQLIWFVLLVLSMTVLPVSAQDDVSDFVGNPDFPAPAFPEGLDWINVEAPLTLDDLAGKVVILDFWTYGCINCLHMIPILEQLEEKYADELVVVGVHSAKFSNEGQTENIREIVQRYGMKHPVINDHEFEVWNTYRPFGVNAWPTFAVIDPRGNLFAVQPGEIPFEAFDRVIGNMVTYFDTQGELVREPIDTLAPELEGAPNRILNYPGKVLADPEGGRLFIADSVNHRLIVTDLDTFEVLAVIGGGGRGYVDGDYTEARFYKPQGMALQDNTLYVADTFNHTVRAIDLEAETVTTIAGTGSRGRTIPVGNVFPAIVTDLRSPWDVAFGDDENILYIAMAGTHQIWRMDLEIGGLSYAIGNGREAQFNDTLMQSELAQPSGLYFEDDKLYFADSESSTIRVADFAADQVEVVSGTTDNDLFDYGDVDGPPGTSRLQHALGVTGDGAGSLYIADTYNSRIKVVSLPDYTTETLFGVGDIGGYADGGPDEARLNEPGGLDYADEKLYVADTNNHVIRVIDLEANEITTVTFPNPEALVQQLAGPTVIGGTRGAERAVLDAQRVAPGDGEVILEIGLPDGYKVNDLAPSLAEFEAPGGALMLDVVEAEIADVELRVPATFSEGEDVLFAAVDVYYCEVVNESLCFIEQFSVELPVMVTEDNATNTLSISHDVTLPEVAGSISGIN